MQSNIRNFTSKIVIKLKIFIIYKIQYLINKNRVTSIAKIFINNYYLLNFYKTSEYKIFLIN